MTVKEKVRAKRNVLNECKWVGAKLLWDFYNDKNKKYMHYLDDRGALGVFITAALFTSSAIIIHAAMEGKLRVWNQVDPKEIHRTGKLYDSPICIVSTGTYRVSLIDGGETHSYREKPSLLKSSPRNLYAIIRTTFVKKFHYSPSYNILTSANSTVLTK